MTVVVLNTTYEPLHTVSVRHAMTMLWRGVAAVLEEGPEMFGPMPRPKVAGSPSPSKCARASTTPSLVR